MFERRRFICGVVGAMFVPTVVRAEESTSASISHNELGPENSALKQRVGRWNVTETVWNSPGASPVTTTSLVADRRMMGPMLQELLRPTADASSEAVKRIDYLTYNRVEGRWEYVSMDLRALDGIMTAQSLNRGNIAKIEMTFQPFAYVGPGPAATGQMLRMSEAIIYDGPDEDTKNQYFEMADGTGTMWLAHRYAYRRRS
jgi:hypothetical protein